MYLVELRNEELISVNANDPRIADKCIKVNRDNCKVGKAKNLAYRKKQYHKVFGEENVIFTPLAQVNEIRKAERVILTELDDYRIRGRTNRKNEWLYDISPNRAARIAIIALLQQEFTIKLLKTDFANETIQRMGSSSNG